MGVWRAAFREMFSRRGLSIALMTSVIYVLLLLPFKQFVIIDSIAEIRPASAIPVVMAVLFGPGAALGAAFGNLAGDVLGGTFTAGSAAGFLGNFALALVAWAVWVELSSSRRESRGLRLVGHFLIAATAACVAKALIIATGLQLLGLAPFTELFAVVALNDIVWTSTFGVVLFWILRNRTGRPQDVVKI